VASVGLPFLVAELKDRHALERARVNAPGFDAIAAQGIRPDIHLYTKSADEVDIRARMFAPFDGVPEDPATGSANCALAGLLSHYDRATDGTLSWRIAQGVEMGRPSILEASAEKRDRVVLATRVGGASVMVSNGMIDVD
jgi:trans-2,3-dihydro-3-hydroxyanthranilate isomerase